MKIKNLGRDRKTGLTKYFIDQPIWKNGDYMMKRYYGYREEKLLDLIKFDYSIEENEKAAM